MTTVTDMTNTANGTISNLCTKTPTSVIPSGDFYMTINVSRNDDNKTVRKEIRKRGFWEPFRYARNTARKENGYPDSPNVWVVSYWSPPEPIALFFGFEGFPDDEDNGLAMALIRYSPEDLKEAGVLAMKIADSAIELRRIHPIVKPADLN